MILCKHWRLDRSEADDNNRVLENLWNRCRISLISIGQESWPSLKMHTDVISFTGREPEGLLLDASGRKPCKQRLLGYYANIY